MGCDVTDDDDDHGSRLTTELVAWRYFYIE